MKVPLSEGKGNTTGRCKQLWGKVQLGWGLGENLGGGTRLYACRECRAFLRSGRPGSGRNGLDARRHRTVSGDTSADSA
jgi:hypothetical protein